MSLILNSFAITFSRQKMYQTDPYGLVQETKHLLQTASKIIQCRQPRKINFVLINKRFCNSCLEPKTSLWYRHKFRPQSTDW